MRKASEEKKFLLWGKVPSRALLAPFPRLSQLGCPHLQLHLKESHPCTLFLQWNVIGYKILDNFYLQKLVAGSDCVVFSGDCTCPRCQALLQSQDEAKDSSQGYTHQRAWQVNMRFRKKGVLDTHTCTATLVTELGKWTCVREKGVLKCTHMHSCSFSMFHLGVTYPTAFLPTSSLWTRLPRGSRDVLDFYKLSWSVFIFNIDCHTAYVGPVATAVLAKDVWKRPALVGRTRLMLASTVRYRLS